MTNVEFVLIIGFCFFMYGVGHCIGYERARSKFNDR